MIELVLASGDSRGDSGADVGVGLVVLFLISFVFYWIPTVVAVVRHVPNMASVVVIN
jgi:hypothetical protein